MIFQLTGSGALRGLLARSAGLCPDEGFRDPVFGVVHPPKFYDGPPRVSESLPGECQF